jgi:hypothetical protein
MLLLAVPKKVINMSVFDHSFILVNVISDILDNFLCFLLILLKVNFFNADVQLFRILSVAYGVDRTQRVHLGLASGFYFTRFWPLPFDT